MPREALPIRSKQHASHSNTARNRARLGKPQNKEFRRRGVFPFFELPYELRHEILKLAILQETPATATTTTTNSRSSPSSSSTTAKKSYQQALVLFLTCRWLYEEAAAIFYQEVVLDTRASSDGGGGSFSSPTPFLVRSLTPRLYARTLRIQFYVKKYHLGLFHSVYAPILRDMAQHGRLEHLVLELGYQFPSPSFWGGGGGGRSSDDGEANGAADPFHDDVPIIPGRHHRKDRELHAPLFVTQAPFQGFLKMLHGFSVPSSSSSSSSSSPATMKKITLYLEAADHPPFWCAFHRAHPSGKACGGSWPDDSTQLLKLRWRDLVKTFAGAQAPPADSWGIDVI